MECNKIMKIINNFQVHKNIHRLTYRIFIKDYSIISSKKDHETANNNNLQLKTLFYSIKIQFLVLILTTLLLILLLTLICLINNIQEMNSSLKINSEMINQLKLPLMLMITQKLS